MDYKPKHAQNILLGQTVFTGLFLPYILRLYYILGNRKQSYWYTRTPWKVLSKWSLPCLLYGVSY